MRAVAWAVSRLPWSWMRALGAALGFLAGSILRIRRRHVEGSLLAAGLAPGLAPRVYRSLGAGVFEILWLAGRPPEAIDDCFTISPEAQAAFDRALAQGGVVVATTHTGNWDLAACGTARWLTRARRPARLLVVTKRLSWRALDRYWQQLRAARGVDLCDAQGAARAVQEALRAGKVVGLLVDQAPERASGVLTLPFLGRPARHDCGPVILAARARVPILVMASARIAGEHRLELLEEIDAAALRGGRAAVEGAMSRIAAAVERFVRAHPEQWLWLHRRWK